VAGSEQAFALLAALGFRVFTLDFALGAALLVVATIHQPTVRRFFAARWIALLRTIPVGRAIAIGSTRTPSDA
jgi:hypothetical protein